MNATVLSQIGIVIAATAFVFAVIANLRRGPKVGDLKFHQGNLCRWNGFVWDSVDDEYRGTGNVKANFDKKIYQVGGEELLNIPLLFTTLKTMQCQIDRKHKFTAFLGINNNNFPMKIANSNVRAKFNTANNSNLKNGYVFGCPNCGAIVSLLPGELTAAQKKTIQMQYPDEFAKKA
jgi:hypothetical protein